MRGLTLEDCSNGAGKTTWHWPPRWPAPKRLQNLAGGILGRFLERTSQSALRSATRVKTPNRDVAALTTARKVNHTFIVRNIENTWKLKPCCKKIQNKSSRTTLCFSGQIRRFISKWKNFIHPNYGIGLSDRFRFLCVSAASPKYFMCLRSLHKKFGERGSTKFEGRGGILLRPKDWESNQPSTPKEKKNRRNFINIFFLPAGRRPNSALKHTAVLRPGRHTIDE